MLENDIEQVNKCADEIKSEKEREELTARAAQVSTFITEQRKLSKNSTQKVEDHCVHQPIGMCARIEHVYAQMR